MSNRFARAALVLGVFGPAVPSAAAQRPAPVGAARPQPASGLPAVLAPAALQRAPARAPRRQTWPYVVGGAVVGGLLTAGGIALALDGSDSLTHPVAYVPAVVGGALVGGGVGYAVYRIRF